MRIAFDGPLPYPKNAYLDSIQYASWQQPGDTERLLRELIAAMAGGPLTDARAGPPLAVGAAGLPPS